MCDISFNNVQQLLVTVVSVTLILYNTYVRPLTDVDECSKGTHNCSDVCTNTPGGFQCGCSSGYQLSEDGVSCKGSYVDAKYV